MYVYCVKAKTINALMGDGIEHYNVHSVTSLWNIHVTYISVSKIDYSNTHTQYGTNSIFSQQCESD